MQTNGLTFFSNFSRDVAMATYFGAKQAKFAYATFIHRTGVPKGLEDCDADARVLNGNDSSILIYVETW